MADETFLSGLGPLMRRRFVCIGAAAAMATFAWQPACAVLFHHPVDRRRRVLHHRVASAPRQVIRYNNIMKVSRT
jgi:hypothetical protein